MGVVECAKHDLMEPYPVYFEKDGEFVAEFKYTVLLMPNGTMKITGLPLDLDTYTTENSITDDAVKVCANFIKSSYKIFVKKVSF